MAKHILTQQGQQQLKDELEDLQKNIRPETLRQMREARELGDLRENGAYHAARNKLAMVQGRIDELEQILQNSTLQNQSGKVGVVQVGSSVSIIVNEMERTFMLVSEHEADLDKGKVSVESPLGQVLLGASIGQKVEFNAPVGKVTYEIKSVV